MRLTKRKRETISLAFVWCRHNCHKGLYVYFIGYLRLRFRIYDDKNLYIMSNVVRFV